MKKVYSLLLVTIFSLGAVAQDNSVKKGNPPKRKVTIAIDVSTDSQSDVFDIQLYREELVKALAQYQKIALLHVNTEENPDILLEINITKFHVDIGDQETSTKQVSTLHQTGTDATGKPIFVTSSYEILNTSQTTSARVHFTSHLIIKGEPAYSLKSSFPAIYKNTESLSTIPGSSNFTATNQYLHKHATALIKNEYLMHLSKVKMTGKLSTVLKKYYEVKTAN